MEKQKNRLLLLPLFGVTLFTGFYLLSASLYPGGSQADPNGKGFSWAHNYWCNLLSHQAINGTVNTGRPFALMGLFLLCLSLLIFWFQFAGQTKVDKKHSRIIQWSGSLSMAIACFSFSETYHNLVVNLAGLLGLITTLTVLICLAQTRQNILFAFGSLNALLILLNAFLFFNKSFIYLLPPVQKVTFITFLLWVYSISVSLYLKSGKNHTETN